jgi:type I restriction enzyme M protein
MIRSAGPLGSCGEMKRLAMTLREQQIDAAKLDAAIAANLRKLGYGL